MADKVPIADYVPSHGSHSRPDGIVSIHAEPTHGAHSGGRGTVIGAPPVHGAHSRPPTPTALESDQMPLFGMEPEDAGMVDNDLGENGGCQHIHLLTPLPTAGEASARAKRLKKVPVPWLPAGFFGDHPQLGKFVIAEDDSDYVEWRLVGEEAQVGSLHELSFNPSKAPLRLKLGWLISAIHELEGIHIADEIPDPAEALKERSRWDRKAATYRKWAIAPVEKIVRN